MTSNLHNTKLQSEPTAMTSSFFSRMVQNIKHYLSIAINKQFKSLLIGTTLILILLLMIEKLWCHMASFFVPYLGPCNVFNHSFKNNMMKWNYRIPIQSTKYSFGSKSSSLIKDVVFDFKFKPGFPEASFLLKVTNGHLLCWHRQLSKNLRCHQLQFR